MAKNHLSIYARFSRGVVVVVCTMTFFVISAITKGGCPGQKAQTEDRSSKLAFTAQGNKEHIFDTGVLRGKIGAEGNAIGLSSLVHVPSGTRLDGLHGIFSYYRVLTTNKRYGDAAWHWPSESTLLPNGEAQILWPEGEDRPFVMTAVYRWKDESTLDVKTIITPQKDLSKFEVFLASYFDESFSSPYVYVEANPVTDGKPGFLMAKKSYGNWQMFLGEKERLQIVRDGRWQKGPNPIEWVLMPCLTAPIAVRRSDAGDLAVVLMAPVADCFAIAAPYRGEMHYSLYLSLFGRDIKKGETAIARSRLVVTSKVSDQEILDLYRKYMEELQGCTTPGFDDGVHEPGKGSQ